jgi:transcriptional regulator with XRE-family HTH domain
MTTPEKILVIMNYHGLTPVELADKLEVSRNAVYRWMRDECTPKDQHLDALDGLLESTGLKTEFA